ncbi:GerMN domain-containing protein [Geobacter grbiciae]|uniref:GerMN domain-containing protein n=1 Tax=Geobacter grbiciae TaxID=155042 RepID=UPI001C02BEE5|nr:GerMN domain-containing protein [Geobacter grbiciae]MBT1075361.1 GerMN domain-containing protein [Geobacter grbiciae]
MKRTKPHSREQLVLAAFLIAAIVFGLLFFGKYQASRELPTTKPEPKPVGTVQVTLFFATPDAEGLGREGRQMAACESLPECVESLVDEVANGPVGDLHPTLPPNAVVHDVRIEGETAVVDFGDDLLKGLPGGSSAEMAAVYSVVNTICLNYPQIKGVKFLVEGAEVETLTGHLDLRLPIPPDFSLEKNNKKVATP